MNSPEIVYQWLMEEIIRIIVDKDGLVLSASPRTKFEVEKEMPEFDKIFGRENIKIFYIKLSEEESIKRNSSRRVCKANGHQFPSFPEYKDLIICPQDDSELIVRDDDKPEIIKNRYRVYSEETKPVLDFFKKNNYPVIKINGEQAIEKVFADICDNF